jgi:hypothetical protein
MARDYRFSQRVAKNMSRRWCFHIVVSPRRAPARATLLDRAAKNCHTARHDGFGNQLLHYYRELT